MQLSVEEIVLFARNPPDNEARLRKMGVPARTARAMAIQSKVGEVTTFAYDLSVRHVRDDEMPPQIIDVSRANYLLGQVLNGGLLQFVHNSGWDQAFIRGVRKGLSAIGAREHLAVFDGAARLIDEAKERGVELDVDNFDDAVSRLEKKHLSNVKLSWRLGRIVDSSWTWGDRWQCISSLSLRYISKWRGVRRLPLAEYHAEVDKLAARIPDLAARSQAWRDARPWEKNLIDRFVAQIGLDYVWYTTFGAREYEGRRVWCWNFVVGRTIGEGHHQAIFVDGEAIIFKGDTDEVAARMPAPECAPGSTATRLEPRGEPGSVPPNMMINIENP